MKMLFLFFILIANTYGQITTTKVAPKVEQGKIVQYDSLQNYLGKDVYKYVGQEIYLKGKSEGLRKFGYKDFYIDYKVPFIIDKDNVYKCCDGYSSKYDDLVGKYFKVLEVIKHPKAHEDELYASVCFLKLEEKETKNVVFFQYSLQFETAFPFIVVGYFEKLKKTEIGREFILRGRNWISSDVMTEMNTGLPVSNFVAGAKWRCVDITIEEKYYSLSLVIANEKGEQIPLGIDNTKVNNWVFEYRDAENFRKKFGNENWKIILDGKVKIGMTKEMCELSWGEPKAINETISAGSKSEQWVYGKNYLYFENGLLKTIQ